MDDRPRTRDIDTAGSPRTRNNPIRELDHRTSDGISVTLLWNAERNLVLVLVVDERQGARLEFEVPAAHALEAFHHPYILSGPGPTHGALAA